MSENPGLEYGRICRDPRIKECLMIYTESKKEKYILVGIFDRDEEEAESLLSELEELAHTAGADVECIVLQHLEHPNASTYVGKGKVEEIACLVRQYEADGIICDDELTPVQIRNLSDILDVKVIDRTILILDIFAAHALTVFNKMDLAGSDVILRDDRADITVKTSLKTGMGVELLLDKLGDLLLKDQQYIDIILPYSKTDKLSVIRSRGRIIKEEYLPEGVAVKAYVPVSLRIQV